MKKLFTILALLTLGLYTGSLNAQAPVPNGDFETGWTDTTACGPWNGINVSMAVPPIEIHTFVRTNDAHGGSYAAKIQTVTSMLGTIPGVGNLGTVNILNQTISGGAAFSDKPTKLTGYIKYTPAAGDTCALFLLLYQGADTMAWGEYYSFTAIPSYTYFEIPIVYDPGITGNPDTLNIIAMSSLSAANPGSTLKLDDLAFEYFVGTEEGQTVDISVSPNPSSGIVTVKTGVSSVSEVTVMNALGQVIAREKKGQKTFRFDLSDHPDGVYLVEVRNGSQRIMKKVILTK